MLKKIAYLIIILSVAANSHAQNFVWNKVYGGANSDVISGLISTKSKNYLYVLAYSFNNNNVAFCDIKIGNTTLTKNQRNTTWLLKFDTSGILIWGKAICEPMAIDIRSITSDSFDNIYLLTDITKKSDSIKLFNHTPWMKLNNNETNKIYLCKLNSLGDFVWQKEFSNMRILMGGALSVFENDIYFYGRNLSKTPFVLYNDTIFAENFIIRTDTAGNVILNYELGDGNYVVTNKINWEKDSIILFLRLNSKNYTNYGINLNYNYTGKIIKLIINKYDKKDIRVQNFTTDNFDILFNINSINHINEKTYILGGFYSDSMSFLGYKHVLNTKNKNNQPYALSIINNRVRAHLVFESPYNDINGQFLEGEANNGYAHMSGRIGGSLNIFGDTTKRSKGLVIYCKIDSLCNILWFIRTGDSVAISQSTSFAFDNSNALYVGTTFTKSIIINNQNYYAKDSSRDFIISKIYDYSITRGAVSMGPYCAGNALNIPYTKDGVFDTANTFIAELSDEEGNFNGAHRELGRLKSNKDSTIKATLPLFDVVSSPHYRIRIVSTKPQVQSYYRFDTLRLLIYSKDTANAGKDTSVCYGSKLQLKTSGGSKWLWSPGNMVADSTKRITVTKAIVKATKFRIIISDSSGCGKTDTAYKWLYPMPKLTIIHAIDTVCKNGTIQFNISGGQAVTYTYQWADSSKKIWGNSQNLTLTDSTPKTLFLIGNDGCSLGDTQKISFEYFSLPKITNINDTTICSNLPAIANIQAVGGLKPYSYQWRASNGSLLSNADSLKINQYTSDIYKQKITDACLQKDSVNKKISTYIPLVFELPKDTTLCNGRSFTIVPKIIYGAKISAYTFINAKDSIVGNSFAKQYKQAATIKVNALNRCREIVSDSMQINTLAPIGMSVLKDTAVCYGKLHKLRVVPIGGIAPTIKWLQLIPTVKSIKTANVIDSSFFVNTAAHFLFIGSDGCSINDSQMLNISARQKLSASLKSAPFCFKDTAFISSKASGGLQNNYKINWLYNNQTISTDTAFLFSTKNKNTTMRYTLTDNCSTPLQDSLVLKPMALASLKANNATQCQQNNLFIVNTALDSSKNVESKINYFPANNWTTIGSNLFSKTFADSGKYVVRQVVVSNLVCKDSTAITLTVLPAPIIKITWQRTTNSFDNSTWRFTATANRQIQTYIWQIDNRTPQQGNPIFEDFTQTGLVKIKVNAKDNNGCTTEATDSFDMLHRMKFYLPNAISLNSDGINDAFKIPGAAYIKDYDIKIYNRWGQLVFKSNNPYEAWIPADVSNNLYIYTLNIFDVYNERHELKGVIEVVQ